MFDWGLSLECVLVVRAPSSLEVRGYSSTMTKKSVLGQLSHRGKVLSLRVSLSVSLSLSLHPPTFSHSLLLILFITKVVKLIMECHCLKTVPLTLLNNAVNSLSWCFVTSTEEDELLIQTNV